MDIQFAQEVESRLRQEAGQAGIAVQNLVARIVEERLFLSYNSPQSGEDWETLLRSQTVTVPAISPEELRRETLYREGD